MVVNVFSAAMCEKRTKACIRASCLRVIELQTRDAFAVREDSGLAEVPQLATIEEGFQDVPLNIQVVVNNRGKLLTEWRSPG